MYCFRMYAGSSDPRPSTGIGSTPPHPSAGETAPPSPRRVKAPRPPEQEGAPSLPDLEMWGILLLLVMGPAATGPRRTPAPWMRSSRLPPSRGGRLGPSGSTSSRRGGRRKRKSGRSSNSCRRSSNSRDGREEKKKRKGGGNKENGSRSCWSNTENKSYWKSRGSNSNRVSS